MNLIKKIIAELIEKLVAKVTTKRSTENRIFSRIPSLRPRAEACKGSILVEFAICMPISIILLFYINDLVKMKRMYSQMEFVGQQMVNIFQNLSKKRAAEEKTLKYEDLCHAASLAYLTIYPGKTMYSTTNNQKKHEFIHCPFFMVYYVQGTTDGKAKCLWDLHITTDTCTKPPWRVFGAYTRSVAHSTVVYSANEVPASSIYPTLKVEGNNPKIIVEPTLFWNKNFMNKNGNKVSNAIQAFGYRFTKPKNFNDLYFNQVVIFTPSAGFPEVRPDP